MMKRFIYKSVFALTCLQEEKRTMFCIIRNLLAQEKCRRECQALLQDSFASFVVAKLLFSCIFLSSLVS